MKTKLLFTIIFFLFTTFIFAQNIISGKVVDQKRKTGHGSQHLFRWNL